LRAAFDRLKEHGVADDGDAEDDFALSGLHWMTAGLFIAAGAETAMGERRGDHRGPEAVRWAPLVAAPLAGAAHAARAVWPSHTTRVVTQVANGLALGVGVAGIASSMYAAASRQEEEEMAGLSERLPSLAPLAFAAVGLLGMLLDREEEEIDETQETLERRARVVERLVPKRKAKLDRIVVHV
jgi:hypothetical protein